MARLSSALLDQILADVARAVKDAQDLNNSIK